MNLEGQEVKHKALGEGKVIAHRDTYFTVSFTKGEKKFIYPDVFENFMSVKDKEMSSEIAMDITRKQESKIRLQKEEEERLAIEQAEKAVIQTKDRKMKTDLRANVAFKCNYCDGGQSESKVGYCGICSNSMIYNNIEVEKRTWCSSGDSPCRRYHDAEISRKELDELFENNGFVCYESQMLRDWKALAGIVQRGKDKGKPMRLRQVQTNSLCVLTTREPHMKEAQRFIFAVFLVDENYEGDNKEAGYVSTTSEYKIALSIAEAKTLRFWKYHANSNQAEVPAWNSGLHRYLNDQQAVQILRDISIMKKGTLEEDLAENFLYHFCRVNRIDLKTISESNGALNQRELME